MKTWTIIHAYELARNDMETARASRNDGLQGIAVLDDYWAIIYRIRSRQADKFCNRLEKMFSPNPKEYCWLCGNIIDSRTGKCSNNHYKRLHLNKSYA